MSFTPQPPTTCYICGAMVDWNERDRHANWHARQQSTERLILDNLSPMIDRGGSGPHGT